MQFSDKEIQLLKTLENFLSKTFRGSSINGLKIDDCVVVLEKAIKHIEQQRSE